MTYAFVQQVEDSLNGSAGSIATPAFGSALTAGGLLVVVVTYYDTTTSVSLSGGGQSGWSNEVEFGTTNEGRTTVFYKENIVGGVTTAITATFGATKEFPCIYAAEFSGIATSGARLAFVNTIDTNTVGTDAISSTFTGTLSAQPSMLFGMTYDPSSADTPVAGTGFTSLDAVWDFSGVEDPNCRPEHKRLTSVATTHATWSSVAIPQAPTFAIVFAEAEGPAVSYFRTEFVT